MSTHNLTEICLNCAKSEREVPLVNLRYRGQPAWVCTQCLPILIHHGDQLADKLNRTAAVTASGE